MSVVNGGLAVEEVFTFEVLSTYPPIRRMFSNDAMVPIRGMKTIDIVRWLDARAPPPDKPPPNQIPHHMPFWEAFKKEFKIFLCTKHRKYQRLRREISNHGGKTQAALVSLISASIGVNIGTLGVVVAPLVVVSLITVLKIGKEAYCKTVDLDALIAVPNGRP